MFAGLGFHDQVHGHWGHVAFALCQADRPSHDSNRDLPKLRWGVWTSVVLLKMSKPRSKRLGSATAHGVQNQNGNLNSSA